MIKSLKERNNEIIIKYRDEPSPWMLDQMSNKCQK
jgi:hypothetical protein